MIVTVKCCVTIHTGVFIQKCATCHMLVTCLLHKTKRLCHHFIHETKRSDKINIKLHRCTTNSTTFSLHQRTGLLFIVHEFSNSDTLWKLNEQNVSEILVGLAPGIIACLTDKRCQA